MHLPQPNPGAEAVIQNALPPRPAVQHARGISLAQVQDYIATHLFQSSLSPAQIVQAFPLSRPTLYRMFEGEGGLVTYIRACRLREAARMLLHSPQYVIVDIAYYVGFTSASDFSRAFRRRYGVAPSGYRQACQQTGLAPAADQEASTDTLAGAAMAAGLASLRRLRRAG